MNNTLKNKKVKIGVFGCGRIVSTVHLPVLLNINNTEITFLYDVNSKTKKELAEKFKLPFVETEADIPWKDIDCFLIAIPYGVRNETYKNIVSQARKNAYIFIEKPVILSEQDKAEFQRKDLFERSFSGFMRRHQSNTNILRDLVSGNEMLGKIKSVVVSSGSKTTATLADASNYKNFAHLSGGGILPETAIHAIDQINYIFPGSSYEIVSSSILYDEEIDVHVEAKINVSKNGVKFPLEANFSRFKNVPNNIVINCEGMILKSGLAPDDKVFLEPKGSIGSGYELNHKLGFATNSYQAFYLEWMSVISDIILKKPSVNRLSDTCESGLLIESLYKVADKNGSVQRM